MKLLQKATSILLLILFVRSTFALLQYETQSDVHEHFISIENYDPIIYFKDMYASHDFYPLSLIDCACNCTRDPWCKSFYLTKMESNANQDVTELMQCTILSEWTDQAYFSINNGIAGILENSPVTVTNFKSPPDNYKYMGVLIKLQKTQAGISAVYDLSQRNPRMSTLGILFDEENDSWPDLTPACLAQLMYQPGLSGTFLRISLGQLKYSATVLCPHSDDDHYSNANCDTITGMWTLTGDLKVGCVSSHCYRYDGAEFGHYKGNQSVSENGIPCQRWDSHYPWPHRMVAEDFYVDEYNMTKAENYCRDADGEGFPWCYQTTGERWGDCKIPMCKI